MPGGCFTVKIPPKRQDINNGIEKLSDKENGRVDPPLFCNVENLEPNFSASNLDFFVKQKLFQQIVAIKT